jgi:hypothetical protein
MQKAANVPDQQRPSGHKEHETRPRVYHETGHAPIEVDLTRFSTKRNKGLIPPPRRVRDAARTMPLSEKGSLGVKQSTVLVQANGKEICLRAKVVSAAES